MTTNLNAYIGLTDERLETELLLNGTSTQVNAQELKKSIKPVMAFNKEVINLSVNGAMTISAESEDVGDAKATLCGPEFEHIGGPDASVGIAPKDLLDALKPYKSKKQTVVLRIGQFGDMDNGQMVMVSGDVKGEQIKTIIEETRPWGLEGTGLTLDEAWRFAWKYCSKTEDSHYVKRDEHKSVYLICWGGKWYGTKDADIAAPYNHIHMETIEYGGEDFETYEQTKEDQEHRYVMFKNKNIAMKSVVETWKTRVSNIREGHPYNEIERFI